MTKQELIQELAKRSDCSQKDTRKVIDTFLDGIAKTLERGDSYCHTGFGTFKTRITEKRIGYNPAIGKQMRYPMKCKVNFKPSARLKRLINE